MVKVRIGDCSELANALVENLGRNTRQLRITTLKLIEKAFEAESYKEYEPEVHTNIDLETSKNYIGPCPVFSLLLKFEKDEININSEKLKGSCLRNIMVLVQTGLVPDTYMEAIYTFLVGCLWIKFVPLQEPIIDLFKEVFAVNKEFLGRHISLFEQYGYVC